MPGPIRTIIFDIGGVVVGSPVLGAGEVERELGLPPNWVGVAIGSRGSTGVWAQLERGELQFPEAYPLLEAELNDASFVAKAYALFLKQRGQTPLPQSFTPAHIDARSLVGHMMRQAGAPNPSMLEAIRRLRAAGIVVAALTNQFLPARDQDEATHLGIDAERTVALRNEFDVWFDSAELGMRKPEPRFYQHALEALRSPAPATAFLDDIGNNLKPARALGVHTILVNSSNVVPALQQVENLTTVDLGLRSNVQDVRLPTHRL